MRNYSCPTCGREFGTELEHEVHSMFAHEGENHGMSDVAMKQKNKTKEVWKDVD